MAKKTSALAGNPGEKKSGGKGKIGATGCCHEGVLGESGASVRKKKKKKPFLE